jgi:GT2 family glycosyltransferase
MSNVEAVIVNYDSESHLARCLAALHAQTDLMGILIVDNGPLSRALPDLAITGRRTRVVRNRRNVGFARACNQGFRLTEAEWVLLVNPDCVLGRDALSGMLRCAVSRPRVAAVGPRLSNADGSLQTSAYTLPTLTQSLANLFGLKALVPAGLLRRTAGRLLGSVFGQFSMHDAETEVEMVTGACALLNRRALREVGLFDPGFFLYNEEKDWCERARLLGWHIWFTPGASALHHIGGSGSPTSPTAFRHRSLGMLRYYAKHRSPRSLSILRRAVALSAWIRAAVSPGPDEDRHYRETARLAQGTAP